MRLSLRFSRMLLTTLGLAFSSVSAAGQSPEIPEAGPKPIRPEMKSYPEVPGWKASFMEGAIDSAGERFVIPSLDIMQAVSVMLITQSPDSDVRLQLFEENFKKPVREETTKGSAVARVMLRTQGDLRLVVKAMDSVTQYQLAIWVGDELKAAVPSLYVPLSQAGTAVLASDQGAAAPGSPGAPGDSGGGSPVLWLILAALLVIAALLGVITLRKKKSRTTAGFLFIVAASAVTPERVVAQDFPPPSAPPVPWRKALEDKAAAHEAKIKKAIAIDPNAFGYDHEATKKAIQEKNNQIYNQGGGTRYQVGDKDKVSWSAKTYPQLPAVKPTQGGGTVQMGGNTPIVVPQGQSPIGVYEGAKTLPAGPGSGVSGSTGGTGTSAPSGAGGTQKMSGGGTAKMPGPGAKGPSGSGTGAGSGSAGGYKGGSGATGGARGGGLLGPGLKTVFGPNWWALPFAAVAFADWYEAMTAADMEAWPDYSWSGRPGIPTACASPVPPGVVRSINQTEWTGPCGTCFADAHDDIEKVLQRFEKLRRVHAQTVDVYQTAMAFGGAAAMVGGIITGAEWMKIRNGIQAKYASYNGVYDDKVVELTAALEAALQKVAACEAQYFNNNSWYERYGFMFLTPIVDRHRR